MARRIAQAGADPCGATARSMAAASAGDACARARSAAEQACREPVRATL